MKKIVADRSELKIKQDVVNDVFNDELTSNVQSQISLFDPVCKLVNKCQSRSYSVADAAEDWLSLELPEVFANQLSVRLNMALNVYSTTANYLHPVYRGKRLSEFQKHRVQDFLLDELDSDGLDSLQLFELNEAVFGTLATKNINNVRTYWRTAERSNANLAKLALRLMKIPASSAQLERLFSNWGHIHSAKRNRILSSRSKKMVHTYYSLRMTDVNEFNDSDESD